MVTGKRLSREQPFPNLKCEENIFLVFQGPCIKIILWNIPLCGMWQYNNYYKG